MAGHNTKKKKEFYRNLGFLCVALLFVCIGGAGILKAISKKEITYKKQEEEAENILEYKGKKYIPKKNIKTYLFMGIDSPDRVEKKKNMMAPFSAIS